MTKTLMIAASALTIAIAMPAYAETTVDTSANAKVQAENNVDTPAVETTTEREIEKGWNQTKDAVSDAWNSTKEAVSETAEGVTAATDSKVDIDAYVENESTLTAEKMLGADLVDAEGKKVAEIEDLILDSNGAIKGAIVSNGGFMGVAEKKTMVEYSQLGAKDADGNFGTSLTKKSLDMTPAFDANAETNGQYRLSELVGAEISNPAGEEVATVDNIVIENGMATKIVVSYMDGLMPKDKMIDFSDADLQMSQDNEATFRLSMSEAADFSNRADSAK